MGARLIKEYTRKHMGFKLNGKRSVCWLWLGCLNKKGYGMCGRKTHLDENYAHRYMYKKYKGRLSYKKELDHLCLIKRCIRPLHLESVTSEENCRRKWNNNPHIAKVLRKLTDNQVRKIRRLRETTKLSYRDIGRKFGVNAGSVYQI